MHTLRWAAREFSDDPYSILRELRGADLAYDPDLEGWVLLRHADVVDLLRDPVYAKDPTKAIDGPYTRVQRAMAGSSMMFMDDPDRKRMRSLLSRAFARSRVESMRPRIQATASALLDEVADADRFDVMSAYAVPLSIKVIADLLGVDDDDHLQFKAWSEDLALEYDPTLPPDVQERVARSRNEIVFYFVSAIDDRRTSPRADLITELVQAHDERAELSFDELVSQLVMLLVAGNVTSTDLIGNGVLALLEHLDQLELLRKDPTLLPNAVEETLRYDSPVTVTDRIATRDVEIAGCPIRNGEWIWGGLVAANRDPAAHHDPDVFDITRENVEHLSFGTGFHMCLGAPLARLEAQVAIGALLDRFPHLALDRSKGLRRRAIPAFRGLAELWVRTDEVTNR